MNIYIHKITIYILSNYIFYRILFNYKAFKIVKNFFLFLKINFNFFHQHLIIFEKKFQIFFFILLFFSYAIKAFY